MAAVAACALPAGKRQRSASEVSTDLSTGQEIALVPTKKTFASLGVTPVLCEACAALGWAFASPIQAEALPLALAGKDIIGLAETGSGKTAAFAIPVLQSLLDNPQKLYALVLAPTRELAFQIGEQFDALGAGIGIKTAVIVGGVDMMTQAIALARKPHVVIGTPGRVVDHLTNTKGFSLRSIAYLVLDEADRMLSLDFEEAINTILAGLPRERTTLLFSATMTSKVAKLQRASLRDPVRVEVSSKYNTVSTLSQEYLFIPAKYKDAYAVYVLNEFAGNTGIVFASTCASAQKLSFMLTSLGFSAVCLHGQMSQGNRLAALAKFKAGGKSVLVATDVASRGLDIPSVDLVLNYDVPGNGKDYIHRVGRTARAGRAGRAITLVTQYDIELYQRIEALLGMTLPAFPAVEEAAMLLAQRVAEAARLASLHMRESEDGGGGDRGGHKRKRAGGGEGEEGDSAGSALARSAGARAAISSHIKRGGRGGGSRGRGGRGRGGSR
jgi:ATP-dependent RNA helicase DDX47/RRP3